MTEKIAKCKDCLWFHKGIIVHHSHCEKYTWQTRYREVLKHDGDVDACSGFERLLSLQATQKKLSELKDRIKKLEEEG